MESEQSIADQRTIYFASKAVHTYKHFMKKHARATYLCNLSMGVDDTFPPMIRIRSVQNWRNWKKLVVLLEEWIEKDGLEKFNNPEVLNVCIGVLKMMIDHEAKASKGSNERVDTVKN